MNIWSARFVAVCWFAALVTLNGKVAADETVGGWPLAKSPVDPGRVEKLDQAVLDGTFKQINSVVIVHDGRLLLERYYNGADRDTTHNPRSVGKTFAGTILGIAIAEGHIQSADQALGDFYDLEASKNYAESKAAITLRQLISMTSGFEGYDFDMESIGNEEFMYPQPDWVRWTLNLPMAADRAPGDAWRYFTAGIVVLGDILNQRVPGGLEAYAHSRLFSKLGISNYEWQHTPQKVANTAGGIQLTPLDFARFGELYRNHGKWRDTQVVPAQWVEESMRPSVETTVPGNLYGYLWWHKEYTVDGTAWPVAYCSGNGGNKIFVFEQQKLVIVITASAYGQPYMHSQVDDMMMNHLLPAVAGRSIQR